MSNDPLILLGRTIPAAAAATLFAVPPSVFDGITPLTLLAAFRAAVRSVRADLHQARARKRATLRRSVAAAHREAARRVPGEVASSAVLGFADCAATEFEVFADRHHEIDPTAARRARAAAAAIRQAAQEGISGFNPQIRKVQE